MRGQGPRLSGPQGREWLGSASPFRVRMSGEEVMPLSVDPRMPAQRSNDLEGSTES